MKSFLGINISGGICEICGTELSPLNSQKVRGDFLCRKCMANVSPFLIKKNVTYEEMVEHIHRRLENKEKIKNFFPTVSYGEVDYIFIDEDDKEFIISAKKDYKKSNADIFGTWEVVSCKKRIETYTEEVQYKDSSDNVKSFVPQYMAYQFDFFLDIDLNLIGYKTISIKLNKKKVDNNQELLINMKASGALSILKDALVSKSFDGMKTNNKEEVIQSAEYKYYDEMTDNIIRTLNTRREKRKTQICPYCDSQLDMGTNICDKCGAVLKR